MQDDIDRPKVIEALLGTRLRGNEFARSPLVCCGAQVSCNAAGLQAPGFTTCEIELCCMKCRSAEAGIRSPSMLTDRCGDGSHSLYASAGCHIKLSNFNYT